MRSIYLRLAAAAALCWTGALSAKPAVANDDAELAAALARRRIPRSNDRNRLASSNLSALGVRQEASQCGPEYGRCPGDLCCSEYGWCGDSIDHCHPLFRCQPDYGYCGWPRDPPQTSTTTPPDSSTTSSSSTTEPPSSSTTSSGSGPTPTGDLEVTPDGTCGGNYSCIGNPDFGPCCSQFGWCGSTNEFCGPGCQPDFGACIGGGLPADPPGNITTTTTPPSSTTTSTSTTTSSSSTTTSSDPAVTLPPGQTPSTDGRCGGTQNCLGSEFGRCCSQFGWCGEGDTYCGYIAGCQPDFGYCDPAPS
ncbi:hypothetical protein VTH82DRAFT_2413 [Thermothelomyces myriococcoides]